MIFKVVGALLDGIDGVVYLKVDDESEGHRGHIGYLKGELTHIHVSIVSDTFLEMNRVQRHRFVYRVLESFFCDGSVIHSIAISALSVSEYLAKLSSRE